jgi:hypothetical protein
MSSDLPHMPPTENRSLVDKYPNVLDFIEHKLRANVTHYKQLKDLANVAIYLDILERYLKGEVLVTFVEGDTYYLHADVEEVNDNNDLTD